MDTNTVNWINKLKVDSTDFPFYLYALHIYHVQAPSLVAGICTIDLLGV